MDPKPRAPALLFGAGYLATGTALAVMGQYVTNQGAAHPSTQLVAFTKYACTFVLSALVQFAHARACSTPGGGSVHITRKAACLIAAVGIMDVVAYALNCLGFARCGSALSMVVFAACGQVFTALTRRLILRRSMTAGQLVGVGIVVLGLLVRALPSLDWLLGSSSETKVLPSPGALLAGVQRLAAAVASLDLPTAAASLQGSLGSLDSGLAAGVALVAASALGYSLLGVLYEWLTLELGPNMSHTQVSNLTSLIGLLASCAYQLAFTLPRWQQLVAARMAERGLGVGEVLRLHAAFGVLFTVHSWVQGKLLERSGAMAVGMVSALRASVVSLASGALFCSPSAPQQCLNVQRGTSAAVVTTGALVWTLSGPRARPWPMGAQGHHDHIKAHEKTS